jgi:integrase
MSVYRDEKRGTWLSKYRYKDWQGNIVNSTKRGFKTRREAVEWERSFLLMKAGDMEMTLDDFIKIYEADMQPRWRESTKLSSKNMIETKILPTFGDKRMCDIKPSDVVKWQNEMMNAHNPKNGKPYSTSYLQGMHVQLSAIFNHATRFYGLKSNPARIAGNMTGPKTKEMQFWTLDEYKRFSATLYGDTIGYHAFEMLYWTGMRKGEMLALTAEDFDFEAQTVRVNKTYHRLRGKDIITPPKTEKSNRTITLPADVSKEMEIYISRIYALSPNDRIFPISPSTVTNLLKEGAEKAGLKRIRVHDLRHSHVSLLIDMDMNALAIAQRVGHETIEVTYRYAHLFPNVQGEVAAKLNDLKHAG